MVDRRARGRWRRRQRFDRPKVVTEGVTGESGADQNVADPEVHPSADDAGHHMHEATDVSRIVLCVCVYLDKPPAVVRYCRVVTKAVVFQHVGVSLR